MNKKIYIQPALSIVLLNSDTHLLTGSDIQLRGYGDGETTTVGDAEED
jgi:hypothetical protein